jgi:hypothetical protein
MGRWIKKFSERAQVSTDSVDILSTVSTLSVSNRAHSENLHAVGPERTDSINDPGAVS